MRSISIYLTSTLSFPSHKVGFFTKPANRPPILTETPRICKVFIREATSKDYFVRQSVLLSGAGAPCDMNSCSLMSASRSPERAEATLLTAAVDSLMLYNSLSQSIFLSIYLSIYLSICLKVIMHI